MAVTPQKAIRTATSRRKAAERNWRKAIRDAAEQGVPIVEIAANAGVTRQHIHRIIKEMRQGS